MTNKNFIHKFQQNPIAIFVSLFVLVSAGLLLSNSLAVENTASFDLEDGNVQGATIASGQLAAGGEFVQFGQVVDPIDSGGPPPDPEPEPQPNPQPTPGSGYDASKINTTCPSIPSSGVTVLRPGQSPDGTAGRSFVFEPGTYNGLRIDPKDNQKFYAKSGVVLNGGGQSHAFYGNARNVYICGFKIQNYNNPNQLGALNAQAGDAGGGNTGALSYGWVIENVEISGNKGAGVMLGSDSVMRNSYIHDNGVIGIKASGASNATYDNVRVSHNGHNNPFPGGWGHEGGGSKFTNTNNMRVINSRFDDNLGPGLWTDINNLETLYDKNIIEDNSGPGIFHEISYSAVISNNIIKNNGNNPQRGWIWNGAIEIASSQDTEVFGNIMENNENGVTVIQQGRCHSTGEYSKPLDGDCYKGRNIYVHDNLTIGGNSGEVQATGVVNDNNVNDIFNANVRFENNDYRGRLRWEWRGNKDWNGWKSVFGNEGSYTP